MQFRVLTLQCRYVVILSWWRGSGRPTLQADNCATCISQLTLQSTNEGLQSVFLAPLLKGKGQGIVNFVELRPVRQDQIALV